MSHLSCCQSSLSCISSSLQSPHVSSASNMHDKQPVQGIFNQCPASPTSCSFARILSCSPSRAVSCVTDWKHQELWAKKICQADSVNFLEVLTLPEEFVLKRKQIVIFEGLLSCFMGKLDPSVSFRVCCPFPRKGR